MMENRPEFIAIWLGLAKIGCVASCVCTFPSSLPGVCCVVLQCEGRAAEHESQGPAAVAQPQRLAGSHRHHRFDFCACMCWLLMPLALLPRFSGSECTAAVLAVRGELTSEMRVWRLDADSGLAASSSAAAASVGAGGARAETKSTAGTHNSGSVCLR